jgi:Tol biopolymer transport system component/DNA-binding winged helix-turn-helix (wHTH) protein
MSATAFQPTMAVENRSVSTYRFGPYQVDIPAGQLRKHGAKVRLAGQPFDILVMLLERAGVVVTREEIQQRLWSSETFVDFENSLNKAINKLRQALSDSAEQPTFIETLPRKGYRFIATIEPAQNGDAATEEMLAATSTADGLVVLEHSRKAQRVSKGWLVASFCAATAIVAGTWIAARPKPNPRVLNAAALTVTSRVDSFGGIQTDGVRLFFVQRRGHRWELSQMPGSGGPIQPFVTPFQNAKVLAVSPDGAELIVAPFESRAETLPLWIMPSVGGAARRLGETEASDAAFTPDGSKITYCNQEGVFEIGRDGLNNRKLVDVMGSKSGLSWSPDGRAMRFAWDETQRGTSKIWAADADGRNLRELLKGWEEAPAQCCGKWTQDGKYYIFEGFTKDGKKDVWALREQHGFWSQQEAPARLSAGPLAMYFPLPGKDARHLYVLGSNTHTEFVAVAPSTREFRSLLGGTDAAWLSFSADGKLIVFRGADSALWRSNLDGSERRELVGAALDPAMPAVQPGGKEVVFRGKPPGAVNSRLYQVSLEGGKTTEIVNESFSAGTPAWSPDGSKLLYASDSAAGPAAGLYVLDWKTREKQKVPDSQAYWKSRWSPDGKYLASVSADNKTIGLFNWSTQKWSEAIRGNLLGPVAWSSDAQSLYYQDILEEDEPVRRLRTRDRTVERVVECRALLEGGVQRCGFEDVMPDGSVVLHLTRGDHDVYVLDVDLP